MNIRNGVAKLVPVVALALMTCGCQKDIYPAEG